jgi:hypothetical protein
MPTVLTTTDFPAEEVAAELPRIGGRGYRPHGRRWCAGAVTSLQSALDGAMSLRLVSA